MRPGGRAPEIDRCLPGWRIVLAVFLYERYDDRAAFEAHLASTHFKTFDAMVAPCLEAKTVATCVRVDLA